ncbi:MAG: M1 family metallopeptidase [Caulobacteraceae bacterium]|nr:M1 family metallopeptidase [Caulobacteraceae bacterium]
MTASILRTALLALGLLVCPLGGALAQETRQAPADHVALPVNVVPERYEVEITPDAKALTFAGRGRIAVTVRASTGVITLNDAELVIDSARLEGEAAAPKITYDAAAQTASLAFGHAVAPGPHVLDLTYHGKIYQQASGFFALDYVTAQGPKRALFTQFENSDERRFIPSWDEPARKATFRLTVVAPAGEMAVSNMPIATTQALPDGRQRVTFAETPKMSSYLLFLAVGDFERIHRMVDGVDLGVVVKRGDTAQAQYALDVESQILPWYNTYFGVRFPLPKLDLIAGPGQSQFFGAMENWGAIFSFEQDLLIDPRLSTEADRQAVYIVTAHEMAHQWFGDLVTMAWWDDLWLNEGFASWMEDKVTDHFHPEWKVWLQSLMAKQGVMQQDAREGTHPIITPVHDILQASGDFDDITYSKGQAVIRMLEAYVGEDAWRAGVRRYIKDHAYGNTTTNDLWAEMDKGAARPITQIAHDFTLQAGVPLITEAGAVCEAGRTQLSLTQGHFAIDPDSTHASEWRVPVNAATLGGAVSGEVVEGFSPRTMSVAGCGPTVVNADQTGYFRTAYSPEGLRALTERLPELSPYDQMGVYNDTATLTYVGREPVEPFLEMTVRFSQFTPDPVVMSGVVGRLAGLDHIYQGLPGQARFRAFASAIIQPTYQRLGWEKKAGESDNDGLLRAATLRALGDFGDPAVVAEAHRRFAGFLADQKSLDAATRRTVLEIMAVRADAATWDQLHGLAKAAKTQLERREDYTLLGLAEDPALAQRALDLSLSGEPDVTTAPGMIAAVSERHPQMAFEFAAAHWDRISPMFEPTTIAGAVPRLLSNATDLALIPRLDAFAETHIPADARQDVAKTDATIRYRAGVRTKRIPEIDAWLAANVK